MATLNRDAAEIMRTCEASAATDITGFGLFGHLIRLLRQHQLTARIAAQNLPVFDGVLEALWSDVIPGAVERNREFVGEDLEIASDVDTAFVDLGLDAQTSGGLLIAVAPPRLDALLAGLKARNLPASVIGYLTAESPGRIQLVPRLEANRLATPPQTPSDPRNTPGAPSNPIDAHPPGCCAEMFGASAAPASPTSATESQRAFAALMRSVQAHGALNERTKELVTFGLVVLSRCAPCLAAHRAKARQLGITQAELDEVAWCAIAMGGAPVKMFYEESLQQSDA
jgi:AhpD family alkylhydroperoxidase